MPETPQEWYDRTRERLDRDGYGDSDLQQWSSWPWTGELTPKPLDPPAAEEPPRFGVGGTDCFLCVSGRELPPADLVWHDDGWMLGLPRECSSLPFALFLMPRRHADLQDLTDAEAARQGVLLAAIERAATQSLTVPRIQAARWGDGGEHLHWWLFARPTGALQLRGTFLSHWADLLPVRPRADLRADAALVADHLARDVGGTVLHDDA